MPIDYNIAIDSRIVVIKSEYNPITALSDNSAEETRTARLNMFFRALAINPANSILREIFRGKIPIQAFIDHCQYVVIPFVLIVKIVCMFP